MRITRRMRLIWKNLGALPLMGLAIDVVAQEVARLAHRPPLLGMGPVTIAFCCVALVIAADRALAYPKLPADDQEPNPELTQRSRVLCQRLEATPVRVLVAPLHVIRGEVYTFIVGDDLILSPRVAQLRPRQRDFMMAKALSARGVVGRSSSMGLVRSGYGLASYYGILYAFAPEATDGRLVYPLVLPLIVLPSLFVQTFRDRRLNKRFGTERAASILALRATGDLAGAVGAIRSMSGMDKAAETAANVEELLLVEWWRTKGSTEVPKADWYPLEFPTRRDGANADLEP